MAAAVMDCDEKSALIVELKRQIRDLAQTYAIQAQLHVYQATDHWECGSVDKNTFTGQGPTPEAAIINWIEANK